MRVRNPESGVCPICGVKIDETEIAELKRGRSVVFWPCRHVLPLDPNYDLLYADGS